MRLGLHLKFWMLAQRDSQKALHKKAGSQYRPRKAVTRAEASSSCMAPIRPPCGQRQQANTAVPFPPSKVPALPARQRYRGQGPVRIQREAVVVCRDTENR
jgi:hypothetical protein